MKKRVISALAIFLILALIAGVLAVGVKRADCTRVEANKKIRCLIYNLLTGYGHETDYEKFVDNNNLGEERRVWLSNDTFIWKGKKYKQYESGIVAPHYDVFTGNFHEDATDTDGNGKYNLIRFNVEVNVTNSGTYLLESTLLDQDNAPITMIESEQNLQAGLNDFIIEIPSQTLYEHKIAGSLTFPGFSLTKEGKLVGNTAEHYNSIPYDYSDFDALLPDLTIKDIEIRDDKLIIIISNDGKKAAFNVAVDIEINGSLVYGKQNRNRKALLDAGDKHEFLTDLPSEDFAVVVDPDNFVDESDEKNNEFAVRMSNSGVS